MTSQTHNRFVFLCRGRRVCCKLKTGLEETRLKVVVRACYGAYFVAQVFKYLAPNFVSERPE